MAKIGTKVTKTSKSQGFEILNGDETSHPYQKLCLMPIAESHFSRISSWVRLSSVTSIMIRFPCHHETALFWGFEAESGGQQFFTWRGWMIRRDWRGCLTWRIVSKAWSCELARQNEASKWFGYEVVCFALTTGERRLGSDGQATVCWRGRLAR